MLHTALAVIGTILTTWIGGLPATINATPEPPETEAAAETTQPPLGQANDPARLPAMPGTADLLDRLEESADSLDAFTADVWYEIEDPLLSRREIRRGVVIYYADPSTGHKRFAVLFRDLMTGTVGTGRLRRKDRLQHYVFDGQWLAEIDHAKRKFIKHQIVPPGKELNPLKLGEGPFPLPVGQPKQQVLARFDVQPLGPPKEAPLAVLLKTHELESLVLIPRPGTEEAKDYARVEIHYDRVTLLPVGIALEELSGKRKLVRLDESVRNPTLTPKQLAQLSIDEPDPKQWSVHVQPWKGR